MGSQTVRISDGDHATLSAISEATKRPMSEILGEAVQELRKNHLLKQTNDAYARLKESPALWQEELAERAAWDSTLADSDESY